MSEEAGTPRVSRPVLIGATGIYLLFVVSSLASLLFKLNIGSQLILAWPYPFLLSLQDWISPDTWWSFLGGYALGFGIVFGLSSLVQRQFGPGRPRGVLLALICLVVSYAPLFALQSVAQTFLPGGE